MSEPIWETSPGLFDTIQVAGFIFYVKPDLSGECGVKLDVVASPRVDGTRIKYQGVEPAKVIVTLMLWEQGHWDDFKALVEVIRPKGAKRAPEPVEIVHPLLDVYGLRTFYVEKAPIPARTDNHYEVKLECVEFFPTPKPSKRPKEEAQGAKTADLPAVYEPPPMPGAGAPPGP